MNAAAGSEWCRAFPWWADLNGATNSEDNTAALRSLWSCHAVHWLNNSVMFVRQHCCTGLFVVMLHCELVEPLHHVCGKSLLAWGALLHSTVDVEWAGQLQTVVSRVSVVRSAVFIWVVLLLSFVFVVCCEQ